MEILAFFTWLIVAYLVGVYLATWIVVGMTIFFALGFIGGWENDRTSTWFTCAMAIVIMWCARNQSVFEWVLR